MGYSTDFTGRIEVTPALNKHEIKYLLRFSWTRHMLRELGEFWVSEDPFRDSNGEKDVIDYNEPFPYQPSLWCNFEPTPDGTAIEWNEREKTQCGDQWIDYLITRFLMDGAVTQDMTILGEVWDTWFQHFTYDHLCNGVLYAQGENPSDTWKIVVTNNIVKRYNAKIVWEE